MFSKPLFIQSFKSNKAVWIVVTVIMCLLLAQFSAMEGGIMDLTDVVFYGMMSVIIPTLYVVITANKLLAAQVDSGSMAYILSTPIKRSTIAFTQMLYLIGTLFVTFVCTTLMHITVNAATKGEIFTVAKIVELNLGSFVVSAAIGGVCFMFSGMFNLSKKSLGAGGMLSVWFVLASMLGLFSGLSDSMDALKIFKFTTITSLFDNASIMDGTTAWIWKLVILAGIAAVTYAAGCVVFKKKNLPL